jgi:hypothetical protein
MEGGGGESKGEKEKGGAGRRWTRCATFGACSLDGCVQKKGRPRSGDRESLTGSARRGANLGVTLPRILESPLNLSRSHFLRVDLAQVQ